MAEDFGFVGAGGASGTGAAIARILAQRMLEQKFLEEQRQNAAKNALRGRGLDIEQQRNQMQSQLRQDALDAAKEARTIRTVDLRPIGGEVTPEEFTRETSAGVPSALYTPHGANLASVSTAGLQSLPGAKKPAGQTVSTEQLARSKGYTFGGTQKAQFEAGEAERKGEATQAAIGARIQDLENKATQLKLSAANATTTAEKAAAQIQLAQAQADLAAAKADTERAKNTNQPSAYATERAKRTLDSIDELSTKVNRWTTGAGSLLSHIPETGARDFAAELTTLKANIAFGELTAMREASKTGGALGQVSDREEALLSSALGALDPGQSPANIRAQLNKIRSSIERWQHAAGASGASKSTSTEPTMKRTYYDANGNPRR